MASRPEHIGSKLAVPAIADGVTARPRVEQRLRDLVTAHRVVLLVATAGAGKTTAAASLVRGLDQPVAWLTVDTTDIAPGRLVTYLDAAVGSALPDLAGVANSAMAAKALPHAEAAGLLSSSVGDRPLVVVIDQLERLNDNADAWQILESFVRYAGPRVRFVLLSRDFLPVGRFDLAGPELGFLGEAELAFTEEEADAALVLRGTHGIDARRAVAETGGWVTGVLFESWRSTGHMSGLGGEADPLHAYLSAHILASLDPRDREFLIDTAQLTTVTAERAGALGVPDATARLASLRRRALPASWLAAHVLQCHPRFREYLLELFHRRPAAIVREQRISYGRLLTSEGEDEEAAEVLIATGALELALAPAVRALPAIVSRRDFEQAQTWMDTLESAAAEHDPLALSLARLLLSVAREEFTAGGAHADQLARRGLRDELARTSGRAATLMTLCYAALLDLEALAAVIAATPPGPDRYVVEYLASPYTHLPADSAALPRTDQAATYPSLRVAKYFHGRLSELESVEPAGAGEWESIGTEVLAARGLGRTARALEIYELLTGWGSESVLLYEAAPDLLLDAGRTDQARAAVVKYDEIAEHKGTAYARLSSLSIRGKMALRFDRDVATALKLFAAFERESPPSGAGPLDHRVGAWRGLALLLAGEDEHAAQILRTAVTRMTTSDCALELASAAVFLAEVEWRLGEEQAADDAADIALDAARTQGSTFLLLEALRFFPAVASRRIDAEPSGAGDWHEVGRQLRAPDEPDRSVQPTGSALLREFGSVALLVDGKEVPTGIRKSLELLAYLLDHGGRAPRERILADVFGGQGRSAQAYLRQARSQLSRAIAWPSAIVADGEELRVSDEFPVSSESVEVEDQLRSARHLDPRARLRVIVDVLDRAQGDLLKGVRSDWVEQRREHVRVLLTEAAHDAARLTFADENYAAARDYAERVLRDEPYRETAWQILMQVAAALGDDDGVILAYRECERALAELHAEPSATTRKLLQQLRR